MALWQPIFQGSTFAKKNCIEEGAMMYVGATPALYQKRMFTPVTPHTGALRKFESGLAF